jgi:CDP-diacylglycerol--glycerol-3-phosphate 3-phosphatidyltransferase
MADLQTARRALGRYFTDPVVHVLQKTGVTPDGLTWTGLVIATGAAVLAATGHLFAAGWVVAFSGLFDLLDGALARATGKATQFGAVLDSTLDRVEEATILIGIMVTFVVKPSVPGMALAGAALVGSQLVSYIRARAEGAGLKCDVGVFTRPERVAILSIGLLLASFCPALLIALGIIAGLSWVTAGQRLYLVWVETRKRQ